MGIILWLFYTEILNFKFLILIMMYQKPSAAFIGASWVALGAAKE